MHTQRDPRLHLLLQSALPPALPSPVQTCLQDQLSPDWRASKAGLFMGMFCWSSTLQAAEIAPCPSNPIRAISP